MEQPQTPEEVAIQYGMDLYERAVDQRNAARTALYAAKAQLETVLKFVGKVLLEEEGNELWIDANTPTFPIGVSVEEGEQLRFYLGDLEEATYGEG